MTGAEVYKVIDNAKRALKTAETKARRYHKAAVDEAWRFFGNSPATDVERAAKHNAIKRADATLDADMADARIAYIDKIEKLRERAGEWADLVPRVK